MVRQGILFGFILAGTCVYSTQVFLLFRAISGKTAVRWSAILLASLTNGIFMAVVTWLQLNISALSALLFLLVLLEVHLLFDAPGGSPYGLALYFVYFRQVSMSVSCAVMALATGTSLSSLIAGRENRVHALVVTLLFLVAAQAVLHRICPREKLRVLLEERSQLRFLNVFGTILLLYQLINAAVYFQKFSQAWFTLLYLVGCLLFLAVYFAALAQAVGVSGWTVQTRRRFALEQRLEMQMRHYAGYHKYTESIRAFRHDHEHVLGNIRRMVDAGDRTEALRLLEQMDHHLQEDICCYSRYSNHPQIDAAMLELASRCAEQGVRFEANILLPDWLALPDLALGKILAILSDNAVEACAQLPADAEKWILLYGREENGWFLLSAENTFDRAQPMGLDASRRAKSGGGRGLRWLKKATESKGGFMVVEADRARGVFKIVLHCCQPSAGEGAGR